MAMTADQVIVHQARGLHPCIGDGRPAKPKPVLGQILGQANAQRCKGGHIRLARPRIVHRLPIDMAPDEISESHALFDLQKRAGVADRCLDLAAMAHDAGIGQKPRHLCLAPTCDGFRLKTVKGAAKSIAFAQDRDPGKASLKPVEHQLFPQGAAIMLGHTPFGVVIQDIQRVIPAPDAAAKGNHWKNSDN